MLSGLLMTDMDPGNILKSIPSTASMVAHILARIYEASHGKININLASPGRAINFQSGDVYSIAHHPIYWC